MTGLRAVRMTGITIQRDTHSQQFVTVHNRVARDNRLSRSARGLLVELLSMPPGARITLDTLIKSGPEGRDAIRRMLRGLESCGYIVRTKEHDERGRIYWPMTVYETPQTPDGESSTTVENTSMVPPAATEAIAGHTASGFPSTVNPTRIKDGNLKTKSKDGPAPRSAGAGGADGPAGARTPRRYARARGAA